MRTNKISLSGWGVEIVTGTSLALFSPPQWLLWIGFIGGFMLILYPVFKKTKKARFKLIVDYKEGEESYQQWDPDNQDRQYMLHRIRIFNDGLGQVNQISARFKSISPEPISGKLRGLPCDLHVMGRDAQLTQNEPKFDLEGKADKFIDVIYLGRRGYNANEFLRPAVKWPQAQSIFIAEDKGYKLVISIFANGERYCEKSFKLKKVSDKNYELRHRFSEL